MKNNYEDNVSYDLLNNENKSLFNIKEQRCYYQLPANFDKYKYFKINKINNLKNYEYRDFFLNYIGEMLNLKYEIGEDYFMFECFSCKYKNLLVASIVRFLTEQHIKIPVEDFNLDFIKALKNNKSKYKNKLKRFCDIYSTFVNKNNLKYDLKYFPQGHFISPLNMKIKSTKDFTNSLTLSGVNIFFQTSS